MNSALIIYTTPSNILDYYSINHIPIFALRSDMTFTEKITVLDLLIATISQHEKTLDALIERLEKISEDPAPLYRCLLQA